MKNPFPERGGRNNFSSSTFVFKWRTKLSSLRVGFISRKPYYLLLGLSFTRSVRCIISSGRNLLNASNFSSSNFQNKQASRSLHMLRCETKPMKASIFIIIYTNEHNGSLSHLLSWVELIVIQYYADKYNFVESTIIQSEPKSSQVVIKEGLTRITP